ncbi:MAG: HD domain-containing phosphohydrolase [Planctomycetota bacterium]
MMDQTVLIVDDDEMNIAILEEILGERFPLLTARNGQEAVEQVETHRPWLVLMDIMMPVMNGYDACRAMKIGDELSTPQIILVSAKASTGERVAGYEAGADDYIIKPFEDEELVAKIRVQHRLREAVHEAAEARQQLSRDNDQLTDTVNRQHQELVDSRDLLVFALANLADSRDPETGEHLERIRCYCKLLTDELAQRGPYRDQIDSGFKQHIYQASPLHDIGKVGIPDVILLKPGRLTDREFDLMKQHCLIGARALENVAQHSNGDSFLQMAMDIARSHHERWDGSGYPDGLAGEDIPLSARIAALADVFDALTSVRVYKDAFTVEVARSMIEEESGRHFDPAVVDAFLACFEDFNRIALEMGQVNSVTGPSQQVA